MKSLIVDDDKYVRMGLGKLIPWEAMHFTEVLYADNGASAYDIAIKAQPDLIITDVKMPIMDGVELCKKLSEADIETYIVMLSAYDDFEFTRAALNYNVKDYILKPLNEESIKQLIAKIEAIVSRHHRKQNFRRIIYSKELASRISASLHGFNRDDINSLFLHDLPEMQLEQTEVKDFCLLLIDLLFDHFVKNGYTGNEKINDKRKDAVEHILNAKTNSDIYSYTFNLYSDMLEFHGARNPEVNPLVNEMCLYIEKYYMDCDLNVAKIANDMHIAPGYAGPLFKKHKGISMLSYITNLRIEKASKLLEDISLKVSEIGQMTGIPDVNHFCKVFKKTKGLSPTEYRNIRLLRSME